MLKGEVTIHYHNKEQYEEIIRLVKKLGVCASVKGD